jgi:hypothetical protein
LLSVLDAWRESRVTVEVQWLPGLERLAHLTGALGKVDVREEPDRWSDVRVWASVPVGEAARFEFDSHGLVEADWREEGTIRIHLNDNIVVVVSRVS